MYQDSLNAMKRPKNEGYQGYEDRAMMNRRDTKKNAKATREVEPMEACIRVRFEEFEADGIGVSGYYE